MDGKKLIDDLKRRLELRNDAELARWFGYTPAGINQIKSRKVTTRTIVGLIKKASVHSVEQSADDIVPIVEFFPTNTDKTANNFLPPTQDPKNKLKNLLSEKCGLYSFYNSELEIIYVGMNNTNTLFTEMKNAYNRTMNHYERYYVKHPRNKFQRTSSGNVRKITRGKFLLKDAASFFSAYEVPNNLVRATETLIIRMIPNDLLNVRIEGNTRLPG